MSNHMLANNKPENTIFDCDIAKLLKEVEISIKVYFLIAQ